ncbi:MAG: hypothetical protein EA355_10160 [Rhodobacteraceae bacterium]|nr:MAG: hypothetical protein EA355_10160 [Paracoccaceae bacterium]
MGTAPGRGGAAYRAVAAGALFVGTPLADIRTIRPRAVGRVLGMAAAAILLAAPVTHVFVGRRLRGLSDFSADTGRIAAGDVAGAVAALSRRDEIGAAIAAMEKITQQNSALAEESASAAKGLTAQAEGLDRLMNFFSIGNERRPAVRVARHTEAGGVTAAA